jgi:hypothetical protein
MNELLTTVFWSALTLAVFFGWRRLFLALKPSPDSLSSRVHPVNFM